MEPVELLTMTLSDGRLAGLVRGAVLQTVQGIERYAHDPPAFVLDDAYTGRVVRVTVTVESRTAGHPSG